MMLSLLVMSGVKGEVMNKIIGDILDWISDRHDDVALTLPFNTPEEKERAIAYKNYNIPVNEFEYMERQANIIAYERQPFKFYFYINLYKRIISYKLRYLF